MATKSEAYQPKVHNMVRAVGSVSMTTENGDTVQTVDQVDRAVSEYLERGYALHSTHYLGAVRSGQAGSPIIGHSILYVLTLNGSV